MTRKEKEKRKTRKSFLGVALARDFANRSFNAISRLKRSKRIVGKEGGEAEGECARSSEIISWCPLQATKEEERKRTGLSQSFLDTRRSFYCEKLAG